MLKFIFSSVHFNYTKHENSNCMIGHDLHAMTSDGTSDHDICMEWCNNNENCGSFTFWHGKCYFKRNNCKRNVLNNAEAVLYLKQGK